MVHKVTNRMLDAMLSSSGNQALACPDVYVLQCAGCYTTIAKSLSGCHVKEQWQSSTSLSTVCPEVQMSVTWHRRVQGLDATAARTFYSLRSALERLGVELVLTHMPTTRCPAPSSS